MKQASLLILLVAISAFAADPYPQFRGPRRDGNASLFQAPTAWPKSLAKGWETEVGEGFSTPLLSDRHVFVLSRQGNEEVVRSLDRATGRVVWQDRYAAPFTKNSAARHVAPGPFATGVLAAGKLYTSGVNSTITAYDANTGKMLWRRQPTRTPDSSNLFFGNGISPLLDEGRLILHWGDDKSGEVVALDAATGKTLWSYAKDTPGYGSPVVVALAGVRQYVIQTQQRYLGLDAGSGKLLWAIEYGDLYNETVVSPLFHNDLLLTSGPRKPLAAYRISRDGSGWKPAKVWEKPGISIYMSTPALDGGVLYGLNVKGRGRLFAVDVNTGAELFSSEGRYSDHLSVSVAGNLLLMLTNDAQLIVAEKSPKGPREIARYDVAKSATWAQPVFAGKQIIIKDDTHVRSYSLP
jgi:outer membrane protein assembly factor BamB